MKRLLRIVVYLTILGTLGAFFLLATGVGLRIVQKSLQAFSGGRIAIAAVEGKLLGRFQLEKLRVDLPEVSIQIDTFGGDWSPAKLLQRSSPPRR